MMNSAPLDPVTKTRIRRSFNRQGFMGHIGARVEKLSLGQCIIDIPFRPEIAQQHGFFHGGLVGTLVDNAGAYAAFTLIKAGQSMVTVEFKVNLLSPAEGKKLRAIGNVVRAGRSLTTSQVEVYCLSNSGEKRCAIGIVTMMMLANRGDS